MSVKRSEPPGKIAYTNARLLDPASDMDAPASPTGGVLTDGKNIVAAGADIFMDGVPKDALVIDCDGKCLAPGLVDMRIQLGQMSSAGMAAVTGGVTSMVCLPNTDPIIDDEAVLDFLARRARKLGLAKLYSYGAISKRLEGKQLAELGMLSEGGAVAFTDGERTIADPQLMRQALSYGSTFDLLIVNHPEDPSLAADGVMHEGEESTRLGLGGIPRQAEIIMIERDLRLLELAGGRLHIPHISTFESVEAIRKAKQRGLNVTCDTAPPYFALNISQIGDYRTFAKLSPPLRPEEDRLAIVEGLKDGTIDVIASDHTPRDEESKRLTFSEAAAGGVGLNSLLAISLDLYHNRHMELLDVLRLITVAPATLLKLPAGQLKAGQPADLVVFDPNRGWEISETTIHSKAKNSPFDKRPVQGMVFQTIVDGRSVYNVADVAS